MPDETLPLDQTQPLAIPPRDSVKMTEKPEEDSTDPNASAVEETFTGTLRLHLSQDEEDELALHLDRIITTIKQARESHGWDANWDLWEDSYFGILADRQYGQSNIHVPLAQEIVDTTDAVFEQALFGAETMLGVQPRESATVDQVKRKEQFLDYAFKVDMHLQERLEPVGWEARVLGTGVLWLPWLREMDRIRDEEVYDGTNAGDMQRFQERYPEAEKDYPQIVNKLKDGKKVTLTVEYNEPIHDAPDPTYIPLREWIVRDTAQWFRLHRESFVGHTLDFSWDDLVGMDAEGYYDQGKLERLKFVLDRETAERELNADYQKKPYSIKTGIVRWRRPGETRERRYLVDFEQDSRTILRVLHYPFWHNRVNYIPFYIQRSRKYIYGLSLIQKIEHPQAEIDAIHSLTLDAVSFSSLPMFKARKDSQNDFNPLRDGMYPGKTFYLNNPEADAQQFQVTASSAVSVLQAMEQTAMRHGELASGALQNLSGLESARDPQAPATKALQQTSQALRRIGKYLSVFSSSLIELAFQTCELYYQFCPKGKLFRVQGEDGVPAFPTISRQELRLRVDYYPHFSTASLNPDQEKRDNVETGEFLLKLFPELVADPEKKNELADIILSSAGSSWSKKKSKFLLKPQELEMLRRAKALKDKQQEQQLKQLEQAAEHPQSPNPTPRTPIGGMGSPPAPLVPTNGGRGNGLQ